MPSPRAVQNAPGFKLSRVQVIGFRVECVGVVPVVPYAHILSHILTLNGAKPLNPSPKP